MIAPDMDVRDTESKQLVLAELLEQGMVLVTLDARVVGVDVPAHLADDPQLRLNLSYRFGLPMTLDESGVDATLTFGGQPHKCRIPWESIYLMVSHVTGRPILFPADVPSEFFPSGNESTTQIATLHLGGSRPSTSRPKLQVLRAEEDEDEDDESAARTPPKRGHLRVVK